MFTDVAKEALQRCVASPAAVKGKVRFDYRFFHPRKDVFGTTGEYQRYHIEMQLSHMLVNPTDK